MTWVMRVMMLVMVGSLAESIVIWGKINLGDPERTQTEVLGRRISTVFVKVPC